MAVSLAQHSRAVQSRPRASTVPTSMATYNPSEVVAMPMPEQFHLSQPVYPDHAYSQSYSPAPPHRSQQYQPPPHLFPTPSYAQQSPIYYASPAEYEACETYRPPLPPKYLHPADSQLPPPSPHGSSNSSSSEAGPSSWRTSIEPDPLPPHSNPQALTQSQSRAFESSEPIPTVHIGRDEVRNDLTGLADFRIFREAGKTPSFLSTKPLLTVTKVASALPIGTIRFHALTSNRIDLTINSHETSISHQGVINNRWAFQATSTPNEADRWYWKKDRSTGGAVLESSKRHGTTLARMKGDLLTFEKARLCVESYEEIIVSAIAMAEAARRQKRKSDIADIGSAIGDFTGSHGAEGGCSGQSYGRVDPAVRKDLSDCC